MIKLDLRDRSVTGEQRVSMRLLFVFRTTEKFPRLQESSATRYLLVRVPRDAMNEGQKLGYRTAHCCMASRDLCVNRSIKAGIDNYNERLSYNVKIALRWRLLFPYDKLLFLHSELTGKPVTYVILMIILSLFTLPTIFFYNFVAKYTVSIKLNTINNLHNSGRVWQNTGPEWFWNPALGLQYE